MSAQSRSGGGGGMQTVGYEAAHFPLDGGGGGFGAPPHRPLKPTTAWSSMPFGATPVWPWIWSKKPTPVTVPVPLSLRNELDGGAPHVATNAFRALRIFSRALGVAP